MNCVFFGGMNCGFSCAFFRGMNCGFSCAFFFVLGSAGKAQKKAQTNQHFFGKHESQASCPRQPSDQRPSKCLTPFPFPNLLSKKTLRSEPIPGAGM